MTYKVITMIDLRKSLLAAALAVFSVSTALADNISISFESPIQLARPGDTVTFTGTITNLTSSFVDLNGCALNLPGQFTTDDCALFFNNAPFFLNPNETNGPFAMFTATVNVPFTGLIGLQPPGIFTVLGFVEAPGDGPTDGSTLNVLAEQTFQVNVVPEPGSAVLLCLALSALVLGPRSHQRRRP